MHYCVDKNQEWEVVEEGHICRKIKSYDNNLMVVDVSFEDEAVGAEHKHPHEQISYCLDGIFDYSIEDKIYHLEKGDTIFVPKGLRHGCKLLSSKGRLLDIFTPYREDFVNVDEK